MKISILSTLYSESTQCSTVFIVQQAKKKFVTESENFLFSIKFIRWTVYVIGFTAYNIV